MIVSPHFTIEEMLASADHPELAATAHEVPVEVLLSIARLTWSVLLPLRQRFGRITVSSGYRPRALNAKVGGADTSRHLTGCAVDFVMRHPAGQAWEEIRAGGIPWTWDRLAYYEQGGGRFHADIDPTSDHQRGLLYLGDGGWRPV